MLAVAVEDVVKEEDVTLVEVVSTMELIVETRIGWEVEVDMPLLVVKAEVRPLEVVMAELDEVVVEVTELLVPVVIVLDNIAPDDEDVLVLAALVEISPELLVVVVKDGTVLLVLLPIEEICQELRITLDGDTVIDVADEVVL